MCTHAADAPLEWRLALTPFSPRPHVSVAIDNIAAEANEMLQEAGILDTTAICQRFSLPTDFLLDVRSENAET